MTHTSQTSSAPAWSHFSSTIPITSSSKDPFDSVNVDPNDNSDKVFGQGHGHLDVACDDWGLLVITAPESHEDGRHRSRCRPWIIALNVVALLGLIIIVLTGGPVSDYEKMFSGTAAGTSDHGDSIAAPPSSTLVFSNTSTEWTILGEELIGLKNGRANRVVGFGHNVAISQSGDRFAVARTSGRRDAPGQVFVYTLNKDKSMEREQVLHSAIPSDLVDSDKHKQPTPLAMSANGKRIAYTQGNRVVVFESQDKNTQWAVVGVALQSESKVTAESATTMDEEYDAENDDEDNRLRRLSHEDAANDITEDRFGTHLAFGHDGLTLAVMGYNAQDQSGFVRIFQETVDSNTGRRRLSSSDDIVLDAPGDSLAMSSDESTIAVGMTTLGAGVVQVFGRYTGSTEWIALGSPMMGSSDMEEFGGTVSLSEDGTILAIGAKEGGGDVRVYRLAESDEDEGEQKEWTLLGQPLSGSDQRERFGSALALSRDGSTLVVGAPGSPKHVLEDLGKTIEDSLEQYMHGKAIVYEYDNDVSDWTEIGHVMSLQDADGFGKAIGLSADHRVIVGAPHRVVDNKRNVGSVHVFDTNQ